MNEMLRTLRHSTRGLLAAAFALMIGGHWPLLGGRPANPVLLLMAGALAVIAALAWLRGRRSA
jgi:hypothetical protein